MLVLVGTGEADGGTGSVAQAVNSSAEIKVMLFKARLRVWLWR